MPDTPTEAELADFEDFARVLAGQDYADPKDQAEASGIIWTLTKALRAERARAGELERENAALRAVLADIAEPVEIGSRKGSGYEYETGYHDGAAKWIGFYRGCADGALRRIHEAADEQPQDQPPRL